MTQAKPSPTRAQDPLTQHQAPNPICLGKVEASGEAGPRVVRTHLAHAGGRDFSSR